MDSGPITLSLRFRPVGGTLVDISPGANVAARWTGPLTFLAVSALTAASAQSGDQGALIARIDSLVEAEVRDGPTAGMSVAVFRRGELLHAKAYGFADLEHRVPA